MCWILAVKKSALPAGSKPVLNPLFIVAWAMDESIAFEGFVLALLGLSAGTWICFSVGAGMLMLFHRPKSIGENAV